jgi:hypothetical protein
MGNWATLPFTVQPPTTNQELLVLVVPAEMFLEVLGKYCTDRKVRDDSPGPLKYTDCVGLIDIMRQAPGVGRQAIILGAFGNAYIKTINGVKYIILKGYAGNRTLLQWLAAGLQNLDSPKYGINNSKVGFFEAKPLPQIVGELVKEARTSVKIGFFLWCGLDVLEEILQDEWYLSRLGVRLASDMVKTVLSAAIGVGVGIAVVLFLPEEMAAAAVVASLAMFAGTIGAGFRLEALDKQYRVTEQLEEVMMKYEDRLKAQVAKQIDTGQRLVDEIQRGVQFTLDAFLAARQAAFWAKRTWDRTKQIMRGIPELGESVFGIVGTE